MSPTELPPGTGWSSAGPLSDTPALVAKESEKSPPLVHTPRINVLKPQDEVSCRGCLKDSDTPVKPKAKGKAKAKGGAQ